MLIKHGRKNTFFQKMGGLWRASKSRMVSKIRSALNDEEPDKLKPENISSIHDWNDFIKDQTSEKFKKSMSSTTITRVMVWTKVHTKKDGQPINSQVADTLDRIKQNTSHEEMSHLINVVEDAISKVLGPDRGHIRGLGFGVTKSMLTISTQKDQTIASLEKKKYNNLTSDVDVLKNVVSSLLTEKSFTTNTPHKCMLLDWVGSGEVIAEGRWSSSEPSTLVHHIPLGLNAVRVWVDTVKKPNSFLWRRTFDIIVIDDVVGTTIAWPIDKVKLCE